MSEMWEMSGFVLSQVVSASKALGITSDDVERYREEHKCNTQKALDRLIAER